MRNETREMKRGGGRWSRGRGNLPEISIPLRGMLQTDSAVSLARIQVEPNAWRESVGKAASSRGFRSFGGLYTWPRHCHTKLVLLHLQSNAAASLPQLSLLGKNSRPNTLAFPHSLWNLSTMFHSIWLFLYIHKNLHFLHEIILFREWDESWNIFLCK